MKRWALIFLFLAVVSFLKYDLIITKKRVYILEKQVMFMHNLTFGTWHAGRWLNGEENCNGKGGK